MTLKKCQKSNVETTGPLNSKNSRGYISSVILVIVKSPEIEFYPTFKQRWRVNNRKTNRWPFAVWADSQNLLTQN